MRCFVDLWGKIVIVVSVGYADKPRTQVALKIVVTLFVVTEVIYLTNPSLLRGNVFQPPENCSAPC